MNKKQAILNALKINDSSPNMGALAKDLIVKAGFEESTDKIKDMQVVEKPNSVYMEVKIKYLSYNVLLTGVWDTEINEWIDIKTKTLF